MASVLRRTLVRLILYAAKKIQTFKRIFCLLLSMSKVYSIILEQKIPVDVKAAWNFFSHPKNLAAITPKKLHLHFINNIFSEEMYAGQIIEYKVRPFLNIPFYWMTEITHIDDFKFFVDEQHYGPYSLWHHQHHFKAIEGGTVMTDIVHYKIPFWFLGDIANSLFVKAQLKKIFDYRYKAVEDEFGKW